MRARGIIAKQPTIGTATGRDYEETLGGHHATRPATNDRRIVNNSVCYDAFVLLHAA